MNLAPCDERPQGNAVTVTVIIPTYSMQRWDLLCAAVQSVENQTFAPRELIICVDNNPELFRMAVERWESAAEACGLPIRVLASEQRHNSSDLAAHARAHGARRRFGAGNARNIAATQAVGDILAFLDDDAVADRDWLSEIVPSYENPKVLAVGGAPLPQFETARPRWMPLQFDWVFGCAYEGMPESRAPSVRLIGANMSVRAEALAQIGGFHSIDFDDMDMCHRVALLGGEGSVVYNPQARVRHYVPAERVTWQYFWRRCFFVNKQKVETLLKLADQKHFAPDLSFVFRTLTRGLARELISAATGDGGAVGRAVAIIVGIACAGAGNLLGQARYRRPSYARSQDGSASRS